MPEYVSAPKIIPLETQYDQVSQSDQEETSIVNDTNEEVVDNELDNDSVFESDANSENTSEVVKDNNNAELPVESPKSPIPLRRSTRTRKHPARYLSE